MSSILECFRSQRTMLEAMAEDLEGTLHVIADTNLSDNPRSLRAFILSRQRGFRQDYPEYYATDFESFDLQDPLTENAINFYEAHNIFQDLSDETLTPSQVVEMAREGLYTYLRVGQG